MYCYLVLSLMLSSTEIIVNIVYIVLSFSVYALRSSNFLFCRKKKPDIDVILTMTNALNIV